jgi:hypothetical protein
MTTTLRAARRVFARVLSRLRREIDVEIGLRAQPDDEDLFEPWRWASPPSGTQ